MKKWIFLISAILLASKLFARNSTDTIPKDTLKMHFVSCGANFNFLFGSITYLEVSPEILFNSKRVWRPGLHFTTIYYKDNLRIFDYKGIGLVNELVFSKKYIIYAEFQKYFYNMKFPYHSKNNGYQIFTGLGGYFHIFKAINAKFLFLYGFYSNPFLQGPWLRYYIFF